jgi:hypothetical protein
VSAALARKPRARKPKPRLYASGGGPGGTLNAETTGIPAAQWFQDKNTTADEDREDLAEEVGSYVRHLEAGITPLCSVTDLLTRVHERITMDISISEEYEASQERVDELEARLRNDERLARVIDYALRQHAPGMTADGRKSLAELITIDVQHYIDESIEPAEGAES